MHLFFVQLMIFYTIDYIKLLLKLCSASMKWIWTDSRWSHIRRFWGYFILIFFGWEFVAMLMKHNIHQVHATKPAVFHNGSLPSSHALLPSAIKWLENNAKRESERKKEMAFAVVLEHLFVTQ